MNVLNKNNSKFFSGTLILVFSSVILKIIGLIYKVPLSYLLGDEGMGYFNSAYTVYMFFYIAGTGGIPKAISILTSKYEAEDKNKAYSVYKISLYVFSFCGLVLTVLFFVFAKTFSTYVGNTNALATMYCVAPSVFFVCIGGVIRGYLNGKMKFAPIAIAEIISGFSKLVIGLLFAYMGAAVGYDTKNICALTILGISLGSLFSFVYLYFSVRRTINPDKKTHLCNRPKTIIKETLKIALPITVASLINGISNILDLTLIMNGLLENGYSTTVATVLYGNYTTLAVPMFTLVTTLITPICVASLPIMATAYAKEDKIGYKASYTTALRVINFISIPLAVCYFVFSNDIFTLIFEDSSAILGAPLLSVLAPSLFFYGPLSIVNTALEARGKVAAPVFSLTAGAAIKIALSSLLIGNENFGILSIPASTVISYAFSLIVSTVALHRTGCKIDIIKNSIFPFVVSVISCICALFSKLFFCKVGNVNFISIIIILVMGVIYLFLSLILSKKTRYTLLNFVKINKNK